MKKIGILATGHSPDALINDLGDYDALFKKLLGHMILNSKHTPSLMAFFPMDLRRPTVG